MLVYIKSILYLFFQAIKQIKKNMVERTHYTLWEVIVSFEYLIQQLEEH